MHSIHFFFCVKAENVNFLNGNDQKEKKKDEVSFLSATICFIFSSRALLFVVAAVNFNVTFETDSYYYKAEQVFLLLFSFFQLHCTYYITWSLGYSFIHFYILRIFLSFFLLSTEIYFNVKKTTMNREDTQNKGNRKRRRKDMCSKGSG